jgi:hypothetical protein
MHDDPAFRLRAHRWRQSASSRRLPLVDGRRGWGMRTVLRQEAEDVVRRLARVRSGADDSAMVFAQDFQ